MHHLFILSNSPGEISVWVRPMVAHLMKQDVKFDISLCLTPCQYASGSELSVAAQIPGINRVFRPKETFQLLLKGFGAAIKNGSVLYLGGDPNYARLLGWRLRIPAFAYTQHNGFPTFGFKQIFYKQKDGDLMAARVLNFSAQRDTILEKYNLPDSEFLLLFPGSRPQHFENFIEFLSGTFETLRKIRPDIKLIVSLSPFITDKILAKYQSFLSKMDAYVIRGNSLELLSLSKLLVTIPGSNTAEAMYMKTPMLIMIPLHKPKYIILDGLAGLIGNIPIIGTLLKRLIIIIMKKKYDYFSLPNTRFKRKLVPELIGAFTQDELQTEILTLWDSESRLTEQKEAFSTIELNEETRVLDTITSAIYTS